MRVQRGIIQPEQAREAARIYAHAFSQKFAAAIPRLDDQIEVIARSLRTEFGFFATERGKILGVAGFYTENGHFTGGGSLRDMAAHLGWISAFRAIGLLALLSRSPMAGELLMDGIAVDAGARGRGIGSLLLGALRDYAGAAGYGSIRLDVIDGNDGARRLYERMGFTAERTRELPALFRQILKISAVTTMRLNLTPPQARRT